MQQSIYEIATMCAPKSFSNPTSHLQMTGVELWTLILHCLSNSVHIFSNILIYFLLLLLQYWGWFLMFFLNLHFVFFSCFPLYFSYLFLLLLYYFKILSLSLFHHLLSLFFTHYTATFLRLHHFLLPAHPKHLHPNDPVHQNMRLE